MKPHEKDHSDIWMEWQQNWNLAARELLDVTLDPEQQAILSAVQQNKMVSVASGTARGKDFVAAVASFLFLYLTPKFDTKGGDILLMENTKVAQTAPTGRQVENIMFPEICRLFNAARKNVPFLPGRLVGNDIRMPQEEWFLTGFKADEHNHEAWSGFHAVNTMFVVTEASGISDDTFAAIEGNLQGNSKILIVFNPNRSIGYAARSQKSDRWKKFRLDGLTAPNVVEKKLVIPGQVDYEWVKDKVQSWCVRIEEDEVNQGKGDFQWEDSYYRPNDLFRIKVRGMFPEVSEDSLIPLTWIELAQKRWAESKKTHRKTGKHRVGSDVAGMGRDTSVNCHRWDDFVECFEVRQSTGNADHMAVAGVLANHLKDKEALAFIDTIGEGAGVFSRLEELGYKNAVSCKYSESAEGLKDLTGQLEFANMRAWLFWAVRDWLNPTNNSKAMLPPCDALTEEATEIKYKFQSNGKIIIEPKEDIKKRLGRSTDYFDALANTFYPHVPIQVNINQILNAFR